MKWLVVLLWKGTLDVVDEVMSDVVLLWNGALEVVDNERVVVLLWVGTPEVVFQV